MPILLALTRLWGSLASELNAHSTLRKDSYLYFHHGPYDCAGRLWCIRVFAWQAMKGAWRNLARNHERLMSITISNCLLPWISEYQDAAWGQASKERPAPSLESHDFGSSQFSSLEASPANFTILHLCHMPLAVADDGACGNENKAILHIGRAKVILLP